MLEILKEIDDYCLKCGKPVELTLWTDDTDGEEQRYFTSECEACGHKEFTNRAEMGQVR